MEIIFKFTIEYTMHKIIILYTFLHMYLYIFTICIQNLEKILSIKKRFVPVRNLLLINVFIKNGNHSKRISMKKINF